MKISVKRAVISFSILVIMTIILIGVTDHFILTLDFYDNSGDPVAGIPGREIPVLQNLQEWICLSVAIYLFVKVFLIALILYTALYLSNQEVRFLGILQVVIYAETLFFIPAIAKIIFFHIYFPNGTLADWHKYYFLSLLSFFDTVPADWFYTLQALNVFEIAYWFALAFGIKQITHISYDQALRTVICAYVPALFIWIAAVTFFMLVMFPKTG